MALSPTYARQSATSSSSGPTPARAESRAHRQRLLRQMAGHGRTRPAFGGSHRSDDRCATGADEPAPDRAIGRVDGKSGPPASPRRNSRSAHHGRRTLGRACSRERPLSALRRRAARRRPVCSRTRGIGQRHRPTQARPTGASGMPPKGSSPAFADERFRGDGHQRYAGGDTVTGTSGRLGCVMPRCSADLSASCSGLCARGPWDLPCSGRVA